MLDDSNLTIKLDTISSLGYVSLMADGRLKLAVVLRRVAILRGHIDSLVKCNSLHLCNTTITSDRQHRTRLVFKSGDKDSSDGG